MSPAACRRVAVAAHDGLARTIRPCHTPLDGDTVFALATGAVEVPPDPETPASMSPEVPLVTAVGAAAADVLARAVLVGVLAAERSPEYPPIATCCPERSRDRPEQEGEVIVLVIRADLVDAMVAHARADHPDEACGVIAGPEGPTAPSGTSR